MSNFDEVVDFVVVGSGGGSMCAGLVMRQAGKSVLILEKEKLVGGTTCKSGGVMWVPNNRFMKRDGVEDSYEKATTYLDTLIGDDPTARGATRQRRLTYLTEAPRMVDFLVDQGIKLDRVKYWPDYYDDLPGGSKQGRTVVAQLFNTAELGEWESRLRATCFDYPADLEDLMELPFYKNSWSIKLLMVRIGIKSIVQKITGSHWVSAGAALQGRMLQRALAAGVDIRPETPVTELIVEDGKAVGVVAQKDGKPVRIGATLGVLVNAGGFAQNQAMRDQYQPGTRTEWSNATEGDTGEMILEMERQGAAISQMEEMVGYQMTTAPGWDKDYVKPGMQSVTAKPHAILVDQSGVRYQNEGGSYMGYCKGMLERNKTVPALPSWGIMDQQYFDKYMIGGTFPGKKKPDSWYSEGYLQQADTIEALAGKIGVDPAALAGTVSRFNGFVAKGHDEDFQRGVRAYDRWLGDPFRNEVEETLGTIDRAPFYAVPVYPGDVGTYGGVVTDEHARVLKEDGTPIPGLYATGVSTASVMGRFYPGAGASVGPSFTWGFVAAKHAANLDNQAV